MSVVRTSEAAETDAGLLRIAALAADLFAAPFAAVVLPDGGHHLYPADAHIPADLLALGAGIVRDPCFAGTSFGFYAGAALPCGGTVCIFDMDLRHFSDEDGQRLDRVAQTASDLVVMKQQEVELRRRKADLRAAKAAVEAALQSKSEFLASMGHEIRTPLTSIMGYTDLLNGLDDLPKDARHYASRIGRAGEALRGLIMDILDLSRLEAHQVDLEPQPTDVRALLGDVLEQLASQTDSRHITLGMQCTPDDALWLMCDDMRLRQLLSNLVTHACKQTQQGTVTVSAELAGRRTARRLRIEVRDSAPALSAAQRANLFSHLVSPEGSRRGGQRGGGISSLGLAISHELVRLMQGRIGVRSLGVDGNCLWFEIPAVAAAAPAPAVSDDMRAVFLEDRKVLIVDDHPVNRELIRLLLKDYGLEVHEARDGAEAVEMCGQTRFDLVFMDIQMPVLDGVSATQAITARRGHNRPAAIVALTAAAENLPDDLHRLGFSDVLTKPIDLPQFFGTVHRHLEGDLAVRLAS
ncbi:response regulator [Asticcacaulis solisilvae]|uniref:response regulator n=1 Tax=Asticcacaulis solisilvae TaxID=1217274 RepID=UPI003FD72DBA